MGSRKVWDRIKFPLTLFGSLSALLAGVIIALSKVEGKSALEWLWWAIVTITTVGYGDLVPHTTTGKLIASLLIISSLVVIPTISASLASELVESRIRALMGIEQIKYRNHILVIGWNNEGNELLDLIEKNTPSKKVVLVNNMDPNDFEEIKYKHKNIEIKFVKGNFTLESLLQKAGAKHAEKAIILADRTIHNRSEDEKTLLAIISLRSINPDLPIAAQVTTKESYSAVKKAGAEVVFNPGAISARLLGLFSKSNVIPKFLEALLEEHWRIKEKRIDRESTYEQVVQSLLKHGNVPLGIVKGKVKLQISDILSAGSEAIDTFIKRKFAEAGLNLSQSRIMINPPEKTPLEKGDFVIFLSPEPEDAKNRGDLEPRNQIT